MTTRKFEVGTLVMLKSGGPTMTVNSLRGEADNIVSVEWFTGNELKRDAFDAENLTTAIIPWASPPILPFPDYTKTAPVSPFGQLHMCPSCANGRICNCTLNSPIVTCAISNSYGASEPR